ncbi:MAG: TIGR00730 family Rossman fold protein [Rhizobiaceae bacterium]
MSTIRSICVYCGSQPGASPVYRDAARTLGTQMARAGISLVYGGGAKGIMGAIADAVMENGGHVTGIIPDFLVGKETAGPSLARLSETIVTKDMHERKHAMFERSDAFVALPGGIGTLEELVEVMTWAQLGRHEKPICLANIAGFWEPVLAMLEHMKGEGFIHTAWRLKPLVTSDPAQIVPLIVDAARMVRDPEGEEETIANL